MNEMVQRYVMQGLESSPVVLGQLLKQAKPDAWDRRPDPERFTLREVVAHMADWDGIFLERIEKIAKQEGAAIQSRDPDELAAKNKYEASDPQKSLKQYEAGRAKLMATLKKLKPEQWERAGVHSEYGKMKVVEVAQIVLGHDGYHLQQVAEWINKK